MCQAQVLKVLDRAKAATVGVESDGSGSGVIISEDGYVLTAAHVSGKPGAELFIVLPDGTRVKARSLGNKAFADAGLIKILEGGAYPTAEMAEPGGSMPGDWCFSLGHPGGFDEDRGVVLRVGRIIRRRTDTIQSDCKLLGGDSGGPLFDLQGRVIGIHSRIGASEDENFHVTVRAFHRDWEKMVAGEYMQEKEPSVIRKGGFLGIHRDLYLARRHHLTGGTPFASLHRRTQTRRCHHPHRRQRSGKPLRIQQHDRQQITTGEAQLHHLPPRQRIANPSHSRPAPRLIRNMKLTTIVGPILAVVLLISNAKAQRAGKLEEEDYLNGSHTIAAFKKAGRSAGASTVKLLRKGKVFALGTALSTDGYIATKATELADANGVLPDLEKREGEDSAVIVQVELPGGERLMGELIGYERTDDVAILRVAPGKLQPVEWAPAPAGSSKASGSPRWGAR